MTRIVTTTYRYKPPPRRREAVAIKASAIVIKKGSRRLGSDKTAAEVDVKPPRLSGEATQNVVPPTANDDRKPAIVTARKPGKRYADVPDLTPEEYRRRGDAADALWRELVRRATGKP